MLLNRLNKNVYLRHTKGICSDYKAFAGVIPVFLALCYLPG